VAAGWLVNRCTSCATLADSFPRTDMRLSSFDRFPNLRFRSRRGVGPTPAADAEPSSEIRVPAAMFETLRTHVEDRSRSEEAGFLLCGFGRTADRLILTARKWLPVSEEHVVSRNLGYVVEWSAAFNGSAISEADHLGAALVLVHSHGQTSKPVLSGDDLKNASRLFPGASRILAGRPSGSIVIGDLAASGAFWIDGKRCGKLVELKIVRVPIRRWMPDACDYVPLPISRALL